MAFTALLLGVVMGIAALVIDAGMQRVTRSDLQALVDVVAMDLAREIRGQRTQAALAAEGDFSDPSSAVRRSVARTPEILGENLSVEVDWGSYDGGVWDTATNPPSAVKVSATADTNYAVTGGSGDVTRTAYAVSANSACYRLGSFAASVRSGDSTVLAPLNDLLGVRLDLASYQALAAADVTLAAQAASSLIGGPSRLLAGSVTYADLLDATIEALSKEPGSSNAAAISALRTIKAASGSVGTIAVGDVLHVSPTDRAALEIPLNVLDIVGSARLAGGEHLLEVDNIQAGVPGVGFQFTGGIALLSGAQVACGEPNSAQSRARNAQMEGNLGITFVNLPSLSIPGLATFQTTKGTGGLVVNIADSEGQLISPPEVHCGTGTAGDPHRFSVAVQSQPASFSLDSDLHVTGDVKVSVLQDLGLGAFVGGRGPNDKVTVEVNVRLDVATTHGGGTTVANLQVPPNDVTPVQTGGAVQLDPRSLVATVADVKIGGTTPPLSEAAPLTDAIVDELTVAGNAFVGKTMVPLINNINTKLLGPAARMVGLRIGGADVYAVGAVCGHPSLWG